MIRYFQLIVASILMAGCATGYHSVHDPILGIFGGFWSNKGPGELVEVGFSGNGLVEKEKVGIYLIYRCAELAKADNSEYFVMYKTIHDAILDRPLTKEYVTTVTYKPVGKVFVLFEKYPTKYSLSSNEIIRKYSSVIR